MIATATASRPTIGHKVETALAHAVDEPEPADAASWLYDKMDEVTLPDESCIGSVKFKVSVPLSVGNRLAATVKLSGDVPDSSPIGLPFTSVTLVVSAEMVSYVTCMTAASALSMSDKTKVWNGNPVVVLDIATAVELVVEAAIGKVGENSDGSNTAPTSTTAIVIPTPQ